MAIELRINGETKSVEVPADMPLLWVLRDVLGMTGTKFGCGMALCGACTVHIDGLAVKSCTLLAVQCEGAQVKTIEGMAQDGKLHPIQEGFWEKHGLQCGFCTPGMMLTGCALLARNKSPTEAEIREAISGNLCRCTGYVNIVKAIEFAAEKLRAQ